jgi:hypothetical protein
LRLAECTQDLLDSGLFAYHLDTMSVESAEEALSAKRAIREMQSQLADALYNDWDMRIRETSQERSDTYSWQWPKVTSPK